MRSKKTVPAKNSEAIFWRPRFTRPLRAGKRANANFACSEGFFCARRAAPSAGAAVFAKPAAVWPVGFCARCLGVFSAGAPLPCSRLVGSLLLLCLAGLVCLRIFAPVCPPCACVCGAFAAAVWPVWLACRGAAGGVPPPAGCACVSRRCAASCGLCSWPGRGLPPARAPACRLPAVRFVCARIFLLSFAFSCLTFSSQISFHLSLRPRRASTFFRKESRQRFAKGLRPFEPHSCALRPIFSSSALLAGLAALRAANRRLTGKRSKKPRSRAQLFQAFLCEGDACALSPITPFFSLLAGLTALRAANRRLAWETPEKPRSKAQLFGRFCAWGYVWPHVLRIYGNLARAFCPAGFLPAAGNRS